MSELSRNQVENHVKAGVGRSPGSSHPPPPLPKRPNRANSGTDSPNVSPTASSNLPSPLSSSNPTTMTSQSGVDAEYWRQKYVDMEKRFMEQKAVSAKLGRRLSVSMLLGATPTTTTVPEMALPGDSEAEDTVLRMSGSFHVMQNLHNMQFQGGLPGSLHVGPPLSGTTAPTRMRSVSALTPPTYASPSLGPSSGQRGLIPSPPLVPMQPPSSPRVMSYLHAINSMQLQPSATTLTHGPTATHSSHLSSAISSSSSSASSSSSSSSSSTSSSPGMLLASSPSNINRMDRRRSIGRITDAALRRNSATAQHAAMAALAASAHAANLLSMNPLPTTPIDEDVLVPLAPQRRPLAPTMEDREDSLSRLHASIISSPHISPPSSTGGVSAPSSTSGLPRPPRPSSLPTSSGDAKDTSPSIDSLAEKDKPEFIYSHYSRAQHASTSPTSVVSDIALIVDIESAHPTPLSTSRTTGPSMLAPSSSHSTQSLDTSLSIAEHSPSTTTLSDSSSGVPRDSPRRPPADLSVEVSLSTATSPSTTTSTPASTSTSTALHPHLASTPSISITTSTTSSTPASVPPPIPARVKRPQSTSSLTTPSTSTTSDSDHSTYHSPQSVRSTSTSVRDSPIVRVIGGQGPSEMGLDSNIAKGTNLSITSPGLSGALEQDADDPSALNDFDREVTSLAYAEDSPFFRAALARQVSTVVSLGDRLRSLNEYTANFSSSLYAFARASRELGVALGESWAAVDCAAESLDPFGLAAYQQGIGGLSAPQSGLTGSTGTSTHTTGSISAPNFLNGGSNVSSSHSGGSDVMRGSMKMFSHIGVPPSSDMTTTNMPNTNMYRHGNLEEASGRTSPSDGLAGSQGLNVQGVGVASDVSLSASATDVPPDQDAEAYQAFRREVSQAMGGLDAPMQALSQLFLSIDSFLGRLGASVDMLLTNEISAFRSDHVKGYKKLVAQYESEIVNYEAAIDKYLSKKAATAPAAAAAASASSMGLSASIVSTGTNASSSSSLSSTTTSTSSANSSSSSSSIVTSRPGDIVGFGSGGVVKVTPASSALINTIHGHSSSSTSPSGQFVAALAGISGSSGTQLLPGDEERLGLASARRAFELARFDLLRYLNDCRGINRLELVECVLTSISSFRTFFHEGYLITNDALPFVNEAFYSLQRRQRRQQQLAHVVDTLRQNLDRSISHPLPPTLIIEQPLRALFAEAALKGLGTPVAYLAPEAEITLPPSGPWYDNVDTIRETVPGIPPDVDLSALGVLKAGYLRKQASSFSKGWQRRWFVLRGGQLVYYRDARDLEPHHVVDVVLSTVRIPQKGKADLDFTFEIISPAKRVYVLQALSETDRQEWVRALQLCTANMLASLPPASASKERGDKDASFTTNLTTSLSSMGSSSGGSAGGATHPTSGSGSFSLTSAGALSPSPAPVVASLLTSLTSSSTSSSSASSSSSSGSISGPANPHFSTPSKSILGLVSPQLTSPPGASSPLLLSGRGSSISGTATLRGGSHSFAQSPQSMLQAVVASNPVCCDCGCERPEWACINHGILICIQCSGVHRSLGVHISKVRSVTLDMWDADLCEFMLSMGNTNFNLIYEAGLKDSGIKKPTARSTHDDREAFIQLKYVKRALLSNQLLITSGLPQDHLQSRMLTAAFNGNLSELASSVAAGADPSLPGVWDSSSGSNDSSSYTSSSTSTSTSSSAILSPDSTSSSSVASSSTPTDGFKTTALHLAATNGYIPCVEYLLQNGGKATATDENGSTPLEVAQGKGHKRIVDRFKKK